MFFRSRGSPKIFTLYKNLQALSSLLPLQSWQALLDEERNYGVVPEVGCGEPFCERPRSISFSHVQNATEIGGSIIVHEHDQIEA